MLKWLCMGNFLAGRGGTTLKGAGHGTPIMDNIYILVLEVLNVLIICLGFTCFAP
jgi:hypothetical protein